ncbi:hypothetical protein CKO36_14735 [Rhabdochromatium marinum]|nr:hypothetical protein [Rhabdochromatium marinum]
MQNRMVGAVVVVLAVWAAVTAVGQLRERQSGAAYFTLTTDVLGVQAGSLVTLSGFEIGQVTAVRLQPQEGLDAQTAGPQSAAELVFRVDFQVVEPVVFPAGATFLGVEEVNPVAPARLVIKPFVWNQFPATSEADADDGVQMPSAARVVHDCPQQPATAQGMIAADGCIPTLAMEEDMRPGLSGLIAAGTETLLALQKTIAEFGALGQEIRTNNERFGAMLSDKPGSLYRLPGALEDAADRVATVSEHLHADMIERVDRMVTPETIASLTRSVAQLEELIRISGQGSQETLENLAAITRSLNQITWELEHDPIGFLRGSGRGTR